MTAPATGDGADATSADAAIVAAPAAETADVETADVGAVGAADGDDEQHYTIDELAAVTGVPSRTIRFYQSKGTLPAPERRGRVAWYREEHVERLKVIAELQDRGLRLDAIRDALQQLETGGDSLQSWLGMGDSLQAPWSDDRPIALTEAELDERVGGHRPVLLAELERAGIIQRQTDSRPATYVVPSPGLLDIALALEAAGIDPATGMEAGELMRRRIGRMTDELVDYFAERAGQGFGSSGQPEAIRRSFEALRPEGLRAVQLIFAQEIERSLRAFVERGGAMPPKRSRSSSSSTPSGSRKSSRDRKAERHARRPRNPEV